MFRRFSINFALLSIFLDLVVIDVALFVATELRAPLSVLDFVQKLGHVQLPLLLYILFPMVWVGVLLLFSVYDGRKNLRIEAELGSLILGSLLAVISMAGVLYLSYRDVSRFLFLMAAGLALLLLVIWRSAARIVFRRQGLHLQIRRVLILGAGSTGMQVGEQINQNAQMGLNLVGYLDDDPAKREGQSNIFGPLTLTRKTVITQEIDDLIIALPPAEHQRMTEIVRELNDVPVRIWVIPDFFALALHQAMVDYVAGVPMLDLRAPALSEYQRLVKRAFDIFLSMLILPLALPVMLLVALAIWLDDRGPIFYGTSRAGENGREFKMIKFRTMIVDADKKLHEVMRTDEQGRLIHKLPNDPRITRVGRFLRRTSLDELPQIINVLLGDMSLVGPRPEIPDLVKRYDLWQRKRFAVPQGITGWWQINGRSDKPMHLNTDEDLYYVQNYSIWLDLRILLRTVWVVIRGKGAY